MTNDNIIDVLKNPEAVYFLGNLDKFHFYKDGDVVITVAGKTRNGSVITAYGKSGKLGDSGAQIFGCSASDPGIPITMEMIENGTMSKANGSSFPAPIRVNFD